MNLMKIKAKVIKSHHSDVKISFKAERGEVISGEEKPTQWKGWLYCRNNAGVRGWVPKAFVTPIKDSTDKYQFNRDYNAFEINANKGEKVLIKETESEWALIENESGKVGWIPLENLEIYDAKRK